MSFTEQQVRQFWAKVQTAGGDACWEWTAARNPKGYGVKRLGGRKGRNIMAHRFSWELFNSEVPAGLLVCHRCDNPGCVNPAHLFLGTPKDNTLDMYAKGRAAPLPLAPLKFTPEQCDEIRVLHGLGKSMRAIAREFSTTHSVVRRILLGEGRYEAPEN